MRVKVAGQRGVVTCDSAFIASELGAALPCATHRDGPRLTFTPNRASLDMLVKRGATFHDDCRILWGHHYAKEAKPNTRPPFATKMEMDWYQREDFDRFKDEEFFALEWDMGLGKSKAFFDHAAYRWCADKIDAVIFITLAGPHRNLTRLEAPKHIAIPYEAHAWVPSRKRGGMPETLPLDKLSVLAFNFEATRTKMGSGILRGVLTNYRCMVVVDESHCIVNPSAQRTKDLLKLGDLAVARATGSGTPVPNTPTDVWAPYAFLSETILKRDWPRFKAHHQQKIPLPGKFTRWGAPVMMVSGYQNVDEIKPLLDPYRSRRTKDILGLPPKIYELRHFELPPGHIKLLNELKKDLIAEYKGRTLTVASKLVLFTRVQQLLSGFMPTDDPDLPGPQIDDTIPRIEAAKHWARNVPGQALAWCTFDYSAEMLFAALKKSGYSVERITSQMPMDEREKQQDAFQAGKTQFLLSTPRLMGTGYTLTAAKDVLYYESLTSMVQRKQSEDRAHRRGQTDTVTYTDLIAEGTPEDTVRRTALRDKHETACIITGDDLDDWLTGAHN